MVIDLRQSDCSELTERTGVCIVGGGAAGIYLAVRLAAHGEDVIVLEAGDIAAAEGTALLGADTRFAAGPYPAASVGRYFGIGGTTTHWGGLLIPHTDHNIRPAQPGQDTWARVVRIVADKSRTVLRTLGYKNGGDFAMSLENQCQPARPALRSAGLDMVCGLMLPYSKKNFRWLLTPGGENARLKVYCNAIVSELGTRQGSTTAVQEARAVSDNGKRLRIAAGRFVIAAGAIESARMLLELNRAFADRLLPRTAATGCCLADHLSVAIAEVTRDTSADAIRLFGPTFDRDWMRVIRFIETNPEEQTPRAFAHFTFDTQGAGFQVAKEVLGAFQARRRPRVGVHEVLACSAELANLGIHRYAKRCLYVRPGSKVELQLDMEQSPSKSNRIVLCAGRDRYGRSPIEIHWRVGEDDIANMKALALRFLKQWPGDNAALPTLVSLQHVHGAIKPHDAYHPVGTCRMGFDHESVVDEHLKVRHLDNLWVVSTGVLPSAGTANPTFTMLCLAEELAERIAARRLDASTPLAQHYASLS